MSSKYFIKLWIEILDDPKMGLMPDNLWKRTIQLFCLAGEMDVGGLLPDLAAMAWRLRMGIDELANDLVELEKLRIVHFDDNWFVTNWEKRQAPIPPDIRMQQMRKRNRLGLHPGYESVTNRNNPVTERESEKERENPVTLSLQNVTSDDFALACQTFEQEIGPLTPSIGHEIELWLNDYGMGWTVDAMRLAAKRGKHKASYVGGILRNWHSEGRDDQPNNNKPISLDAALEEAGYGK